MNTTLPGLIDLLVAIIAAAVAILTAIITVVGKLLQTWYEDYLKRRQSEPPAGE